VPCVTRKRIGDEKTGGMHRAWVFTANMQACVHPSPHGRYSSQHGSAQGQYQPGHTRGHARSDRLEPRTDAVQRIPECAQSTHWSHSAAKPLAL
jgi:hypothetical protein